MSVLQFIPTYVLIFFRVAGMFIYAPLFGSTQIPKQVRVMLAAIIAMGIAATTTKPMALPDSLWVLTAGIVGELVFGLAMGLIASFIFIAVQWAGEIIGQQMGLNISEVFDPQFGAQGSIIGNLYFMFTLVVFLLVDGHESMLIGVRQSLGALPLLSVGMSISLFTFIVSMFHAATILAFQLAAPVLVTMLIVDLCMGFVGKTVPQLNLMSAGLGVRGIVGFLVLIIGIGLSSDVIRSAMFRMLDNVTSAYQGVW